jgi:hypothetical protein
MIRAPGVSSRFRDGAPPSIDLQVWGVFSLKMLQECLFNHVAQLSWGLGSAPFHQGPHERQNIRQKSGSPNGVWQSVPACKSPIATVKWRWVLNLNLPTNTGQRSPYSLQPQKERFIDKMQLKSYDVKTKLSRIKGRERSLRTVLRSIAELTNRCTKIP